MRAFELVKRAIVYCGATLGPGIALVLSKARAPAPGRFRQRSAVLADVIALNKLVNGTGWYPYYTTTGFPTPGMSTAQFYSCVRGRCELFLSKIKNCVISFAPAHITMAQNNWRQPLYLFLSCMANDAKPFSPAHLTMTYKHLRQPPNPSHRALNAARTVTPCEMPGV